VRPRCLSTDPQAEPHTRGKASARGVAEALHESQRARPPWNAASTWSRRRLGPPRRCGGCAGVSSRRDRKSLGCWTSWAERTSSWPEIGRALA